MDTDVVAMAAESRPPEEDACPVIPSSLPALIHGPPRAPPVPFLDAVDEESCFPSQDRPSSTSPFPTRAVNIDIRSDYWFIHPVIGFRKFIAVPQKKRLILRISANTLYRHSLLISGRFTLQWVARLLRWRRGAHWIGTGARSPMGTWWCAPGARVRRGNDPRSGTRPFDGGNLSSEPDRKAGSRS
jgi:hypothetical protein